MVGPNVMTNERATPCPRCKALVMPVDHQEHDGYHEELNKALTQLVEALEALS